MGITNVGREESVKLLGNSLSGLKISAINIGDNDTSFSPGDTSLSNEVGFQGGLQATVDGSDATIMNIQATFENKDTTIQEVGMVSQDDPTNDTQASKQPADVQFSRQTVPDVNLLPSDKLDVTFELQALNSTN